MKPLQHFITIASILLISSHLDAQCISTVQVGNYTANGSSFAQQQVFSCNFAGDYAIVTIPTGIWTFSTSVSSDFITITNTSNSVLATGTGSVQYATTSTVTVRMHIFQNSACDEQYSCRISYVQQDEIPVPQISSSDTFLCFGAGPVTLTAANTFGPQTYWYEGGCNTTPIDSGSSTVVSLTTTTTYYANNTFNGGLGACDSFTVTVTENPVISFPTVNDVLCHGDSTGSITTSVTGGTTPFEYEWNSGQTTADIIDLDTGTYQVIITDSVGCDDTNSVTIGQPDLLTSAITNMDNPLCFGSSTGSATVLASGGVTPYFYSWSNGDVGVTADSLPAGQHVVNIIDSNACIIKDTVELIDPSDINAGIYNQEQVNCFGGSDGSMEALAFGGTGAISYLWSTGATTPEIDNLSAGIYTVTVTDDNNCVKVVSDTITEPTDLSSAFTVIETTCHDTDDGEASIDNTGATEPYTYAWSNGGTGSAQTGLDTGVYVVTITDDNGCVFEEMVTVGFTNPDPSITTLLDSMKLCEGFNISLDAGDASRTYVWSTGEETPIIEVDSGGSYSVTVTDMNGCTNDKAVFVYVETCVGIQEVAWKDQLHVFPNPSHGSLNVNLPIAEDNLSIALRSIDGKLISQTSTRSSTVALDLSNHARGVYYLHVTQDGETVTRKVILQ